MKILIPTLGTRGDIQPYITLANALNKSGFITTIASHPYWESLVKEYNINFVPIGKDVNIEKEAAIIRAKSKNWILGMIRTMKFVFNIIEESSPEILRLCKNTDIVISSHSHIGVAEAQVCNKKYASVTLQPNIIPNILEEKSFFHNLKDKILNKILSPLMVKDYNRIRKKLGLKKVNNFYEMISPDLNLIPLSSFIYPKNKFWEEKNKLVGYWFLEESTNQLIDKKINDFIASGDAPIIVSLGAMAFEAKKEIHKLNIIINAIKNNNMRAIIQGFNKSLENFTLPNNILKIDNVSHNYLFKNAFAVIHHGGFGTTSSVIKAGIPSIVIPHALDQYEWAHKIYDLKLSPKPIYSKNLNEELLTNSISSLKMNYNKLIQNAKILSDKVNNENSLKNTIDLIKELSEKVI